MVQAVLFVCLGNINRSPTAEYVMRSKLNIKNNPSKPSKELGFRVESAATGGHTMGEGAMSEMIAACAKNGLDISMHRARQVRQTDFEEFDLIVAMDRSNFRNLGKICPQPYKNKLRLLLEDYAPSCQEKEVPDPYYTGRHLDVFDLIEEGVQGLIVKERINIG